MSWELMPPPTLDKTATSSKPQLSLAAARSRRILIQLRASSGVAMSRRRGHADFGDAVPGVRVDPDYVVGLPAQHVVVMPDPVANLELLTARTLKPRVVMAQPPSLVVRGTVDVDGGRKAIEQLRRRADVLGVFTDPVISPFRDCSKDAAVGSDRDVAERLCADALAGRGLRGDGVMLAIVDSGINAEHLRSRGQSPAIDAANSWPPDGTPGDYAANHGTVCAYSAAIAAPAARVLDHAVLVAEPLDEDERVMAPTLSRALASYGALIRLMQTVPLRERRLVVSNSWGLYDPDWDEPVGDEDNYSDTLDHPFNQSITILEGLGADILFAAGNCGPQCPALECAFDELPTICGGNSHPSVLTVGAVDVNRVALGYSAAAPGRLEPQKPDLCGYAHFDGSRVHAGADWGTSVACPGVAGVVAAVRTALGPDVLPPAELREHLRQSATAAGGGRGFDPQLGGGRYRPLCVAGATRALDGRVAAKWFI